MIYKKEIAQKFHLFYVFIIIACFKINHDFKYKNKKLQNPPFYN